MSSDVVSAGELFERGPELERLTGALRAAEGGDGVIVAVEGQPGVGKTALLDALAARAHGRGFRVLRAHGVEFERALAYGSVRRLFRRRLDPAVLDAVPGPARQVVEDGPGGLGDEPGDPFAVLHGLYSVCLALGDAGPIALVIDDAQWADDASLRFLAFLRERLEGLPALVAIGLRSPGHGERAGLAAQLATDARTVRVEPTPLSLESAGELLRGQVDGISDELCRAWHGATGGNPFYLRSLAEELARGDGALVGAQDVTTFAPEAVTRAVLSRLSRLGPDAVAVAQAVALFGGDADVRTVAAFTGRPVEVVTLQADALTEAGVLSDGRPLSFVHAIVRAAVEADLPSGRRTVGRRRAAQVLMDAGASAQRVALQLLATEPAGEPWVVDALARGAAEAHGPGAGETAVALLRRALEEPPAAERRPEILAALGRAERHVMAPGAIERLEAALAVAADVDVRAELAVELAAAREQVGQAAEALALLEQALAHHDAAAGDLSRPQAAVLEAQIYTGRLVALLPVADEEHRRARARLEQLDPTLLERRLLAGVLAFDEVARGTAARALELARAALEPPLPPEAFATPLPMVALVGAVGGGAPELVLRTVDPGVLARATGSPWSVAAVSTWRTLAAHHAGALGDAEADGTGALEGFANLPVGAVAAAGVLADVLLDRRDVAAAAAVLEQQPALHGVPAVIQQQFHDLAAANVALGRNDPGAAAALARGVGARLESAGMNPMSVLPWRLILARAELAGGRAETASVEAAQAVRDAERIGHAGALGAALTTLALTQDAEEAATTLEAAIAAAAGSPLVLVRAQLALGALLRRGGRRTDARPPLRDALELATRCGAGALARAARAELQASGARVSADQAQGRWELTASEVRVVRLAAEGRSNRDIAQALFVTTKTVETHLYSAFRKLDVRSRHELAAALAQRPDVLRAS